MSRRRCTLSRCVFMLRLISLPALRCVSMFWAKDNRLAHSVVANGSRSPPERSVRLSISRRVAFSCCPTCRPAVSSKMSNVFWHIYQYTFFSLMFQRFRAVFSPVLGGEKTGRGVFPGAASLKNHHSGRDDGTEDGMERKPRAASRWRRAACLASIVSCDKWRAYHWRTSCRHMSLRARAMLSA